MLVIWLGTLGSFTLHYFAPDKELLELDESVWALKARVEGFMPGCLFQVKLSRLTNPALTGALAIILL